MKEATWNSPILDALDADVNGVKDGCQTPADYGDPEHEYDRIRNGIGLVDYSFYGKFDLTGPGARALADRVCMSPIDQLPINRMMRTFILNEDGTVLSDAHVVNHGDGYRLLTEGAEPSEVMDVIEAEAESVDADVDADNVTEDFALLGLDGPFSWELAKDLFGMRIIGVRYLDVVPDQELDGTPATVYRGGKTGEFNYWIEVDADAAADAWTTLLEQGEDYDLTPAGYETVEVCILENRFISMDKEAKMAENVLELNTRVMIDAFKEEFRGSDAVSVDTEISRRLVGMHVNGESTPEPGDPVKYNDETIGTVANAAYSPTLDTPIAVAFIDTDYAYAGLDDYTVNGGTPAKTVSAPFIVNRSLEVRPQENSYFDED